MIRCHSSLMEKQGKMFNGITNLNLQVYSGDGLDQVSSCCCRNLEAEDADEFIVQRLDQTDEAALPFHQEGASLIAVQRLSSDYSEEPRLSRGHVHRPQGGSHCRVLGNGEGVLRLTERGNKSIWWDDMDEGGHQRVFGWRTAVRGLDKEGQHGPLEVVHGAFSHHPTAVWLHLSTSKISMSFKSTSRTIILEPLLSLSLKSTVFESTVYIFSPSYFSLNAL